MSVQLSNRRALIEPSVRCKTLLRRGIRPSRTPTGTYMWLHEERDHRLRGRKQDRQRIMEKPAEEPARGGHLDAARGERQTHISQLGIQDQVVEREVGQLAVTDEGALPCFDGPDGLLEFRLAHPVEERFHRRFDLSEPGAGEKSAPVDAGCARRPPRGVLDQCAEANERFDGPGGRHRLLLTLQPARRDLLYVQALDRAIAGSEILVLGLAVGLARRRLASLHQLGSGLRTVLGGGPVGVDRVLHASAAGTELGDRDQEKKDLHARRRSQRSDGAVKESPAAESQLPSLPCTSGKNRSCHFAGRSLTRAVRCMNSAVRRTRCGVSVKTRRGSCNIAVISSTLSVAFVIRW